MVVQNVLPALLYGLAGAIFLLWGYRLFLALLPLWGFFGGFWLGAQLTQLFLGNGFLGGTTGWIVGLLAGIAGALLSYLFYVAGIFLIVTTFAVILMTGVLGVLGMSGSLLPGVLTLIVGLVLGLAAVRNNWQMALVVAVTALAGSNLIISAVLLAFNQIEIEEITAVGSLIRPILSESWLWLLVWLLLAGGGIFMQMQGSRKYLFQRESYFDSWG